MRKIRRAIISVTDKSGIAEFAKELEGMGVEIVSTGGTAELMRGAGITVIPISSYTGFPEMLDGRLKTLHPKIHGGILGMRDNPAHQREMSAHGILPVDMVVVNLYAFEKTVAKGASLEEAIENIDIGGPAMLRSAAKNYNDAAAVVDPADYAGIIKEMKAKAGCLSRQTRFALARKVFQLTARYDGAISNYLGSVPEMPGVLPPREFPDTLTMQFEKVQDLRYGENPHQNAAFYRCLSPGKAGLADSKQLQGKELSYNNILDLNAALQITAELHEPAAVIIKHNNPCGVSMSKHGILAAYLKAYACDKTSAFGGIVGFNRTVDKGTAETMSRIFLEAVIAPGYEADALEILKAKKNLRVMQMPVIKPGDEDNGPLCMDMKKVFGGMLLQTADTASASDLKTVTRRGPNDAELEDLIFAWHVCKHVRS
ncbi:MAG: bifunctional phosphoribosylaminoimidazolecarboxamide formyltransferase/IMP cyclohydrolase, partial [Deltaproteobacteria bacterium]|nr:bifunctional phosphoribosylaminoimidazolecarboxamide formyltransferase/IMP cyclohydrolase [Deltaproteobacteria bacterium]